MKSGETAGQGNGHPFVLTARKRSAQARSWKPGRRRQPSGARERWGPDRGEAPQGVRCAARQRDRLCFLAGDAHSPKQLEPRTLAIDVIPRCCPAGSRLYQFDKGSQRCVQARQGWQGQGSKPDGAIGRGAGAASKPTTEIVTPETMSDKIDRKRQLISAWCS